MFEQAIGVDSKYALAYAGMADAYSHLYRYAEATTENVEKAMASIHNALGRTDKALDLLERAYEERDVRFAFIKVDNRWNNLRTHPRFVALVEKMRFPASE